MFNELFNMIAEKLKITLAQEEYKKALEDLRAQALTAPEEGMPEEQEMWAKEWHKRVQHLTTFIASDVLGGTGLGMPTEDKLIFIQMHDICTRWRSKAAQRAEDEKQRVAREREACACQEKMARENERAVKEVTMGEPASEECEEGEEGGDEGAGVAMVVSPVAMPTKKGKLRDPRLTVMVPPRKFTEAFPKGGKGFKPEDDLEGDKVTEATT
ncbi:hypothetical protein PAXINDRAFT_16412 [Paxillus involutus ATCC 200175]|uniref:Uncharacterized protein n=1 Tax=Paxillus involutus ATCC 200175 TaxID=664439 RepID=A0A0C9TIL0_PAXIN|nr:hypothetical protein PAXINDRAFT_16412 [Paxillus involutus ATCC 200175]